MSTFLLKIVTPNREFYSGTVEYVSVDTVDGRAGFLRGAFPRIAVLRAGRIEITVDGEKKVFACGDGMFRIDKDGMTIIASKCCDVDDVGDRDKDDDIGAPSGNGGKEYEYAKAKIAVSLKQLRDKKLPDETF